MRSCHTSQHVSATRQAHRFPSILAALKGPLEVTGDVPEGSGRKTQSGGMLHCQQLLATCAVGRPLLLTAWADRLLTRAAQLPEVRLSLLVVLCEGEHEQQEIPAETPVLQVSLEGISVQQLWTNLLA